MQHADRRATAGRVRARPGVGHRHHPRGDRRSVRHEASIAVLQPGHHLNAVIDRRPVQPMRDQRKGANYGLPAIHLTQRPQRRVLGSRHHRDGPGPVVRGQGQRGNGSPVHQARRASAASTRRPAEMPSEVQESAVLQLLARTTGRRYPRASPARPTAVRSCPPPGRGDGLAVLGPDSGHLRDASPRRSATGRRPATATPRRTSTPGVASAVAASTASTRTRLPVSHSKRSSPSRQPPLIVGGSTSRMKFSRDAPASARPWRLQVARRQEPSGTRPGRHAPSGTGSHPDAAILPGLGGVTQRPLGVPLEHDELDGRHRPGA